MKKIKKIGQPKTVDIVLECGHTHKGADYVKGDTITVNQSQAERLEEARIGFRKKPVVSPSVDTNESGRAPDET